MYPEAIDPKTAFVLEKIGESNISADFYLAGGTALALQLGHRQSIDLDWFSRLEFSNQQLKERLSVIGDLKLVNEAPNTINGLLDNVRVSFLRYDYDQLFPLILFGKIYLADERDIAAMKISVASSRGGRKDFIDLFFLLEKYTLAELLRFFEQKYENIKYNKLHILKSLTYFDDADAEPMPKMLKRIDWPIVKKALQAETDKFLKDGR